jgi:Ni,Fe-hydrogenase I small subunit
MGEFYSIQQQIQQPTQNGSLTKTVNSKTLLDERACPPLRPLFVSVRTSALATNRIPDFNPLNPELNPIC